MRQRGARNVEHREDVGPEGSFQLAGADVVQRILRMLLGGVVDQDVEPAVLLDGLGHHLVGMTHVGHIPGDD
ncbi:hypothetical protein D3C81_2121410 [compost metagenome]